MVMTKDDIYFLGSEKKAQFFSPLTDVKENSVKPNFHIRNRDKVKLWCAE